MLLPVPSDIKRSRFRYFRDVSYSPQEGVRPGPRGQCSRLNEADAFGNVLHDDAADPYAVAVSVSDDEMPPSFSGTCLQRVELTCLTSFLCPDPHVVGLGLAVVTGCLALTLLISWII